MPDKLCPDSPSPEEKNALLSLRAQIDELDKTLQELFERRMALVEEIAAYKRKQGAPVLDAAREEEKLASAAARAASGLADYDAAFFRHLMTLARQRQEELLEKSDNS